MFRSLIFMRKLNETSAEILVKKQFRSRRRMCWSDILLQISEAPLKSS